MLRGITLRKVRTVVVLDHVGIIVDIVSIQLQYWVSDVR